MSNYKTIEFSIGNTIERAVEILKDYNDNGVLVKGDFNGITLYSDNVTLDSAYLSITGKSYEQFKEQEKQSHEDYLREEKEYQKQLPKKISNWIKKGEKVLDSEYLEEWNRVVPIRARDLYHGKELDASLEIIKSLNDGQPFEKQIEIIENQGHSGMSYSLVCSMVKKFSKRGIPFVSTLNMKRSINE